MNYLNQILTRDCLEVMKELPDNSIDLIFTDPPYALGSETIIRDDGRPDYKKAVDFMNKWDMPTGDFWEKWYKEAYRILKYGGHCLMFGIDRQNFLFKYYASYAKFLAKQSIYWYFISNFPKAFNLSKGLEAKEKLGSANWKDWKKLEGTPYKDKTGFTKLQAQQGYRKDYSNTIAKDIFITTPLAKKYEGYKYSVAPLKQVVEEIMVFQKPTKTGSCLHDTLAYENGDKEITVGALNIDGNRVEPLNEKDNQNRKVGFTGQKFNGITMLASSTQTQQTNLELGRYPSQTLCSNEVAEVLDKQSGLLKTGGGDRNGVIKTEFLNGLGDTGTPRVFNANTGGCSKILHKCDYEEGEFDIFNYNPKASKSERSKDIDVLNNHPTVKPQKLLIHILKLFKTPNKQICLDTFSGSGSTLMACKKLGFDYIGVEINPDYVKIAQKRVDSIKGGINGRITR